MKSKKATKKQIKASITARPNKPSTDVSEWIADECRNGSVGLDLANAQRVCKKACDDVAEEVRRIRAVLNEGKINGAVIRQDQVEGLHAQLEACYRKFDEARLSFAKTMFSNRRCAFNAGASANEYSEYTWYESAPVPMHLLEEQVLRSDLIDMFMRVYAISAELGHRWTYHLPMANISVWGMGGMRAHMAPVMAHEVRHGRKLRGGIEEMTTYNMARTWAEFVVSGAYPVVCPPSVDSNILDENGNPYVSEAGKAIVWSNEGENRVEYDPKGYITKYNNGYVSRRGIDPELKCRVSPVCDSVHGYPDRQGETCYHDVYIEDMNGKSISIYFGTSRDEGMSVEEMMITISSRIQYERDSYGDQVYVPGILCPKKYDHHIWGNTSLSGNTEWRVGKDVTLVWRGEPLGVNPDEWELKKFAAQCWAVISNHSGVIIAAGATDECKNHPDADAYLTRATEVFTGIADAIGALAFEAYQAYQQS